MNIFELKLNKDNENADGVYAMSIVGSPAMGSNHVLLADEQIYLKVQDEKKKILTGVALIPNKLITRYDKKTKEPYQIFFSKDTIETTSQQFLKNFNQKSITVEHMLSVEDVTVVESWIKSDDKLDKSVALGIEAPVGSWIMTLKVENDELWDGLIETGLLNGFSIEGQFEKHSVTESELTEMNENKHYMDKKEKNVITAIRELFLGKDTNVELEAVAEVSKWWMDLVDGTTFELGSQLMRKPYEDGGEAFPLSAGEYELEDGRKVLTDAEGIIRYIFGDEPEVEPETPEAVVETPVAEPTVADVVNKIKVETEPQLVPHTDAPNVTRKPKLKFDNKLTVQERIKRGLGTLN